jgi:hypothetical protein
MTLNRRKAPRMAALVAAVVTGVLGGVPLAAAAPASAATDLDQTEAVSAINSSHKFAVAAKCEPGWRVIGGGGSVEEFPGQESITHRLALTQLRPVRSYAGTRDAYVVNGAETYPGTINSWRVHAYAICARDANPSSWLKGLHIVRQPTGSATSDVRATAAVCPAGEVVVGTGGETSISGISAVAGQVVLQVARPSHPGDIARIQAHEDVNGYFVNGYPASWSVTAYAVCAPKPPGYAVQFAESFQTASETEKRAFANCGELGKRLYSSGAAVSNVAPGHVSLQGITPHMSTFPGDYAQWTTALAVENSRYDEPWDFIVATSICAD